MSEIKIMFNRAGLLGVAEQIPSTGEIIGWKPMQFTEEKQLAIVKFLSSIKDFEFESVYALGSFIVGCRECFSNNKHWAQNEKFEYALAELVNELWQDVLNEDDKRKIMEILKG